MEIYFNGILSRTPHVFLCLLHKPKAGKNPYLHKDILLRRIDDKYGDLNVRFKKVCYEQIKKHVKYMYHTRTVNIKQMQKL